MSFSKKSVPLSNRVLIILLLTGLLTAGAYMTVVTGDDDAIDYNDYGNGFMDLVSTSISDNGTFMTVAFNMGEPLSTTTDSCCDIIIEYYPLLIIDSDNNRKTGMIPWYTSLEWGAEYKYEMYNTSIMLDCGCYNQAPTCRLNHPVDLPTYYVYNATQVDWDMIYYDDQGWPSSLVQYNGSKIAYTISLSSINATQGNEVRVSGWVKSTFYDYYYDSQNRSYIANYTVPQKTIVVDGDASDWAGVSPAGYDGDDVFTINGVAGYSNLTSIYMASDNEFLYLMIILAEPVPYANGEWGYSFNLDLDNDGSYTTGHGYSIQLTSSHAYAFEYDNGSHQSHYMWESNGDYAIHYLGTKYVEAKLRLSKLGLNTTLGNTIVTIIGPRTVSHLYNPAPIITYKIGAGITDYTNMITSWWAWNWQTGNDWDQVDINYTIMDGLNMTIRYNATLNDYLVFNVYTKDPNNILEPSTKTLNGYYSLYVYNTTEQHWPLQIMFTYDENLLSQYGLSEDSLGAYYYDGNNGEYKLLDYTINSQDNTITIYYPLEAYQAGDDAVLTIMPNASTGSQQNNTNTNTTQPQPTPKLSPDQRRTVNKVNVFLENNKIDNPQSFMEHKDDIKRLAKDMIRKGLMEKPPRFSSFMKEMMKRTLESMYGPYLVNYPDTQGRIYLLYWLYM